MEIREMTPIDLDNGFLKTLESLSTTGKLSSWEWQNVCSKILNNPVYKIFVAEEEGKIIGTTTLLLERKFIHGGGIVGHVEDVAVEKDFQKNGVGMKLINHVISEAKKFGCYKVILDCSEENVPFYERLGFKRYEVCMRLDL